MKYVISLLVIVTVIAAVIFFQKNTMETKKVTSSVGDTIELDEGQSISIGTLQLTYDSLYFPLANAPEGVGTRYVTARIVVEEHGDQFAFWMNEERSTQKFHEYFFELVKRDEKKITLKINASPVTATIKEEEAVATAMKIARDAEFPDPEAVVRSLADGVWDIDIQSETHTDIFIHVKINAETGEVLDIVNDSRA